jgi:hypothetical protein
MAASREAVSGALERLGDIPDPAAGVTPPVIPASTPPAAASLTRADRQRRALAALAFTALWVAGASVTVGLRPDVGSPHVLAAAITWLAAGALMLGLVLRPRTRGLPAGIRVVQHALWAVPAVYVVVAAIIAEPTAPSFSWDCAGKCLAMSAAIALGALLAAAAVLRRTFLAAAGWRGAVVGALAGLAGSIGVHVHCPMETFDHLLAAHGAPIFLFALAGAVLGRIGGRP